MKNTTMTLILKKIIMAFLIFLINSQAFADLVPGPPLPESQPEKYVFFVSNNSAAAPVLARGADCAQSLADVLNAGSELERLKDTESSDSNYILTENKGSKIKLNHVFLAPALVIV